MEDMGSLDDEEHIPWVVEGVIARGMPILWYGQSGVGKSNLLYTLLPALERGGEWLGFKVHGERHNVLWLHLDTGSGLAKPAIKAAYRGAGLAEVPEGFLLASDLGGGGLTQAGESIAELVKLRGISLVVLDTFQNLGVRDNDADAVIQALNDLFRPALRAGAAVVIVDHVSKPGQFAPNGGATPRGSGAKSGFVRAAVHVQKNPDGSLKLSLKDNNWKGWPPVNVRLEFGNAENGKLETLTAHATGAGSVLPLAPLKIAQGDPAPKLTPGERAAARQIVKSLKKGPGRYKDLAPSGVAQRALKRLLETGQVVSVGRGLYALASTAGQPEAA